MDRRSPRQSARAPWVYAVVFALVLGACSGTAGSSSSRSNPVASREGQHNAPVSTTPAERFTVRLPFGAHPARWETVATFKYGAHKDQLGFRAPSGLNPLLPSAAVVTRDGIWIADPVKSRIAHFTRSGRYRGQIRGLSELGGRHGPGP